MTTFINWLRVELLRLRSLDWGSGSKSCHWLKDGVAKFNSFYSLDRLAETIGISEDEILHLIDSAPVLRELEEKSFTASWAEKRLTLSWLEEGILEWKTDIHQEFCEEDGKYYVNCRMIQRVIYLDDTERIVSDSGQLGPTEISEARFIAARERILNDQRRERTS